LAIPNPPLELTFEDAFEELQSTVEQLRGDALTLETSLALFERGTALAAHCNELLTNAELRVTQLDADVDQGIVEREPAQDW
jgi:exodeoxyribonuclease VII small subunit